MDVFKGIKNPSSASVSTDYNSAYFLDVGKEFDIAMSKHVQHHAPEPPPVDGMTLLYRQDLKHKGRR